MKNKEQAWKWFEKNIKEKQQFTLSEVSVETIDIVLMILKQQAKTFIEIREKIKELENDKEAKEK